MGQNPTNPSPAQNDSEFVAVVDKRNEEEQKLNGTRCTGAEILRFLREIQASKVVKLDATTLPSADRTTQAGARRDNQDGNADLHTDDAPSAEKPAETLDQVSPSNDEARTENTDTSESSPQREQQTDHFQAERPQSESANTTERTSRDAEDESMSSSSPPTSEDQNSSSIPGSNDEPLSAEASSGHPEQTSTANENATQVQAPQPLPTIGELKGQLERKRDALKGRLDGLASRAAEIADKNAVTRLVRSFEPISAEVNRLKDTPEEDAALRNKVDPEKYDQLIPEKLRAEIVRTIDDIGRFEHDVDAHQMAKETPQKLQNSIDQTRNENIKAALEELRNKLTAVQHLIPPLDLYFYSKRESQDGTLKEAEFLSIKKEFVSGAKAAENASGCQDTKTIENATDALEKLRVRLAELNRQLNEQSSDREKLLNPKERDELWTDVLAGNSNVSSTQLQEIARITAEHRNKVAAEISVFNEIPSLDRLLAINDDSQRKTKAGQLRDAMRAPFERREKLAAALHGLKPTPAEQQGGMTRERTDQIAAAGKLMVQMTDHVPDELLVAWGSDLGSKKANDASPAKDAFEERLENICADQSERTNKKNAALSAAQNEASADLQQFKDIVGKMGVQEFETMDFYFSKFAGQDPDPDSLAQLYKILDKCIARAHTIRDAGGTLAEAQKAMGDIPKAWWPPVFLEELQAWRKVERELHEQRVAELMQQEQTKKLLQTIKTAGTNIADIASVAGSITGLAGNENAIRAALEGLSDVLKQALGADWKGDFAAVPKVLKERQLNSEDAVRITRVIVAAFELSATGTAGADVAGEHGAPGVASFVSEAAPGMGVVVTALGLGKVVVEGFRHWRMKSDADDVHTRSERDEVLSKGPEDAGARTRAFERSQSQMTRVLGEDALELLTKSLAVASAATGAAGQEAASLGLKVTEKGVEYAGRVVLSEIDFRHAQSVKKLIREAQAGNPVARMQLFSDSNYYAKTYLGILVMEEDRLATELIVKRGYRESDLRDKATSAKILADFMMKKEHAFDERLFTDSRSEAIGRGIVKATQEKKSKPEKKTLGRHPYVPNWSHTGGIYLHPAACRNVVATAVKVGLDDQNGKHAELNALVERLNSVWASLHGAGIDETKTEKFTVPEFVEATANSRNEKINDRERLLKLSVAVEKAVDAARQFAPVTTPQGAALEVSPHSGMTKYIAALAGELHKLSQAVDNQLVAAHHKDPNWRSDAAINLATSEWSSVWAEFTEKTAYRGADPGIRSALKAVEASSSKARSAKHTKDSRQACLETRADLTMLVDALNALRTACGNDHMQARLSQMRQLAAEELRALDGVLNDPNWQYTTRDHQATADSWVETYGDAVRKGLIDANDLGVHEALKKYEQVKQAWTDAMRSHDAANEAAAETPVIKAAAKINALISKTILRGNYPLQFGKYLDEIKKELTEVTNAVTKRQKDIVVGWRQEFTRDAWQAAYQNATQNFAVRKEKTEKSAKALQKALEATAQAAKSFGEQSKATEKRKIAKRWPVVCGKVATAASEFLRNDGVMDNDDMRECLQWYQSTAMEQARDVTYTDYLSGTGATFPPAGQLSFDFGQAIKACLKSWNEAKRIAVEQGLVDDLPTGLGDLMKLAKASHTKWNDSNTNKNDTDRRSAMDAYRKIQSIANSLKDATSHANFQAYLGQIVAGAAVAVRDLDHEDARKAPPFAYAFDGSKLGGKHWDEAKKRALASGLIDTNRLGRSAATGVGLAMDTARDAYQEWQNDKSPQKRDQATVAFDVLKAKILAALQTDHPELKKFRDKCVEYSGNKISEMQHGTEERTSGSAL